MWGTWEEMARLIYLLSKMLEYAIADWTVAEDRFELD
jgi:hypothetical protein